MGVPSNIQNEYSINSNKLNLTEFLEYINKDYKSIKELYHKYKNDNKLDLTIIDESNQKKLLDSDLNGQIIIFLFPSDKKLTDDDLRKIVEDITPKPSEIINTLISKKINSIHNINKILHSYNLDVNDLTYSEFLPNLNKYREEWGA